MRLLVFDEELFAGGVETLCANLLPALAELCEELVWVVPDHLYEGLCHLPDPVANFSMERHNWPRGGLRAMTHALVKRAACLFPAGRRSAAFHSLRDARIRALARKHRSTHFLTTCVFAQPFPRVGLPVFGFVCDVNPAIPMETRLNIFRWVAESAGVFAISRFTRDELRRSQPADANKIHAVPLAAATMKKVPREEGRRFDFYYPAAANPHKNHLLLFQACVQLAEEGLDFQLVLSGPDTKGFLPEGGFAHPQMEETRRYLSDHAQELKGRLIIKGEVDSQEVAMLYANARCVVLPSGYEGFGLPLAEALQMGLPVICSDIPAYLEQLALHDSPGNVTVVPACDGLRLAAAMKGFLKNPEQPAILHKPAWTWQAAGRRCFDLMSAVTPRNVGEQESR